jgi:hypothetical protein
MKAMPFFANFGYKADLYQGPTGIVPRAVVKADKMSTVYIMLKDKLEFIRAGIK